MKKSQIFYTDQYKAIEKSLVKLLNSEEDYMTARTAASPRAVGDAIQGILSEKFEAVLGKSSAKYSAIFARRSMADLAFTDPDGFYYAVDVKTHRTDTVFNMPNLTSVERLTRFYEDDNNYFILMMVKYTIEGNKLIVAKVHFVPIEFLSWECLTVGALGWGQIQIANANRIVTEPKNPRKKWMIDLCNIMLQFYPKEIGKIGERIKYFQKAKAFWEKKEG